MYEKSGNSAARGTKTHHPKTKRPKPKKKKKPEMPRRVKKSNELKCWDRKCKKKESTDTLRKVAAPKWWVVEVAAQGKHKMHPGVKDEGEGDSKSLGRKKGGHSNRGEDGGGSFLSSILWTPSGGGGCYLRD